MLSRRRFIAAGVLGAAALAGAGWWTLARRRPATAPGRALDAQALAIVAAIVPAMLGPALPGGSERSVAIRETVDGVDRAVAGLLPAAQREVGQLFALLSLSPARQAFAGVAPDWPDASEEEVAAFLDRWRDSAWTLKRSAYDALHQLVMGAWYGNPRAWTAIGYGGPPAIDA
jgi:hypothetical protein